MGKGELPDMNAIVREGDRRQRRRFFQVGALLVAGSVALYFGTRGMTSGGMTMLAPYTGALGLVFVVRGLSLRS